MKILEKGTGQDEPDKTDLDAYPPGAHMGFAGLLRAWRKAAGVTQLEAATAVGRSERWIRDLERGAAAGSLDREQCQALADLLRLGRDERHALLLYNVGGSLDTPDPDGDPRVRRALRLLIDQQMPSPAYLSDSNWNILAYNQTMAEWWPWVMEPGANLIRWALTSPEARLQYTDWHKHARAYVRLLRFALTSHGNDPALMQLIGDVCKDPDVQQIWQSAPEVVESRDGHVFRITLPALNWEVVEIVSHVLYPASLPDCRLVVLNWLHNENDQDEVHDSLGGLRDVWAECPAEADEAIDPVQERKPTGPAEPGKKAKGASPLVAQALRRLSVPTAHEAALLAGEERIELPFLSRALGTNSRLTLSPSTNSVIWAVKGIDSQWDITEVDAYTILVRTTHTAVDPETIGELKLLVRAVLPEDKQDALTRIRVLIPQLRQGIDLLTSVQEDLMLDKAS